MLVNDIWGAEHLFERGAPVWEHDLDRGLRLLRLAVDTHLITSHHALPLLLRSAGGLVAEVTDGTAAYNADHYRVSLFYDLAKTSVIRIAWAQAQELRPHGATAVALTPDGCAPRRCSRTTGSASRTGVRLPSASPTSASRRHPGISAGRSQHSGRSRRVGWNGQSLSSGRLAQAYGFADLDGTRPDCRRYMVEVVERPGAPARRRRLPLTGAGGRGAAA